MKRLLFIVVFLFAACCTYADGICDSAFDKAMELYYSGKYKEAKMQFEWCRDYCSNQSSDTYKGWIEKCNMRINEYEQREAHARQESIERAQRVERNRYIYLTAFSPIPGGFSNIDYEIQGKLSDFNFHSDPAESYYAVRININVSERPGKNPRYRNFYFEAAVEVEETASGKVQRFKVTKEEGCTTDVPEEQAEECAADKLYYQEDFFKEISAGISTIINNKSTNTIINPQNKQSSSNEPQTIVVVVYNPANIDEAAKNALESGMNFALNNDRDRRYTVLDHSEEMDIILHKEISYAEKNVSTSQIASLGNQLGAQLVCGIIITKSNNDIHFETKIINVESHKLISNADYDQCGYSNNKPITELNINLARHVAKHLADGLGLLDVDEKNILDNDDEVARNAEKERLDEEARKLENCKKKINRQAALRSLCPLWIGSGLKYKGYKKTGYLSIAEDVLLAGGAVSLWIANRQDGILGDPKANGDEKREAEGIQNSAMIASGACFITAGIVYVTNIVVSYCISNKNSKLMEDCGISLYPTVINTNNNLAFGVSANIKF